jgi:hypothetical protein
LLTVTACKNAEYFHFVSVLLVSPSSASAVIMIVVLCGILSVAQATSIASWHWEQLGPTSGAGFFAAAHFLAPPTEGSSLPHRVLVSGDDGDGLFLSDDGGASLTPVPSWPSDWATYGFASAANGSTVFAAAHWSRGLAVSKDRGATWGVVAAQGLPLGAGELVGGLAYDDAHGVLFLCA